MVPERGSRQNVKYRLNRLYPFVKVKRFGANRDFQPGRIGINNIHKNDIPPCQN